MRQRDRKELDYMKKKVLDSMKLEYYKEVLILVISSIILFF